MAMLYIEGENPAPRGDGGQYWRGDLTGNARMVYIPGAAAVTAAMTARMQRADVVFFRRYAVPRR
jgi:hypothetical protein